MADNQVFDPEFEEIFKAFSQRTAQVRSVNYLKMMRQEGLFWLHGTIIAVDTDRDFWHLSCSMCARTVWRGEDGLRTCDHCEYVNHYDIYSLPRNIFLGKLVNFLGKRFTEEITEETIWLIKIESVEFTEEIFSLGKIYRGPTEEIFPRYNLEVEFVDESGSAWLVLSHEASTRLIGRSVEDVIGFQGAAVTRLPDWIVEDLEGRDAVFEVVKTHEEDVHVFDCPRLSIDELILEECEDNYYPHGVQEEDWDNQSEVTERGENDQEVYRALPVYVGEPSGVNDPDATQASKRRRTE
ncbi:hypothetical protein CASFOL_037325 [Castilleja foliolosa]|uniref:Replication factor A C-terminal domain-containing protein n=1 Tax=Castilleja foliolosa TaxID=1961234 RepID=A0ABD3BNF8_9LAMI